MLQNDKKSLLKSEVLMGEFDFWVYEDISFRLNLWIWNTPNIAKVRNSTNKNMANFFLYFFDILFISYKTKYNFYVLQGNYF